MTRYLTPFKVVLLAVVSVYAHGAVPSNAIIPVLSFLVARVITLQRSFTSTTESDNPTSFDQSIEAIKGVLETLDSIVPGRTLWDTVLRVLWDIDSLDALCNYFDDLSLLQHESEKQDDATHADKIRFRLSPTSPLGAFIRRSQLEFSRLQFNDTVILWQLLIQFRQSTWTQWIRRNKKPFAQVTNSGLNVPQDDSRQGVEELSRNFVEPVPQNTNGSTEDLERLLDHQIGRMQNTGTRLPESVAQYLGEMLKNGMQMPTMSYYIRFLDAWRVGDYSASFDNLHKYFDYTMHSRDQILYQYALLNLAILHADFGAFPEAITAMAETVSTARENNDLGCLNYSLCWLYHFGKAHLECLQQINQKGVLGSDRESLAFIKAKARDTNMWSIFSTALLGETKLTLHNGEDTAQAFATVLKASHVNMIKALDSNIGSQAITESTLFARLGISCQAWVTIGTCLSCYKQQISAEDLIHMSCRLISHLAQKGHHKEAANHFSKLNMQPRKSLKLQHYIIAQLGICEMRMCINREDIDAAQRILSQLQRLSDINQEVIFTIGVLQVELLFRHGDLLKASNCIAQMEAELDKDCDICHVVKIMILKARVQILAKCSQKGFTLLIRAASLAHEAMLLPCLWDAIGQLCNVLHTLAEYEGAIALLESIVPQILEYQDTQLAANTFSLLADAHMGMAGRAKAHSSQSREFLNKSVEYIDLAFGEFQQISDIRNQCEMLAKKATIMHMNGDAMLANDCAAQSLAIKESSIDMT